MTFTRFNKTGSNLKHRITFLRPLQTDGPWPESEFEHHATVWAEIKTERGRRLYEADAEQPQQLKTFAVRYRNDISSLMRIEHKGTIYEINSLTNVDELNSWITIVAREVLK